MKKRILIKITATVAALLLLLSNFAVLAVAPSLEGQTSCTVEELYPGVTATEYYLEEGHKYSENGPQYLRVLEFDPKQEDLNFDVVMAGPVATKKTVTKIVDEFNKNNTEHKKVIAAVNGDLWMMAQYNSRVEGSGTVFNGYSDAVVKKELCVPRGADICDGEIICSQNTQQETPYEEAFQSFGLTTDGEPLIGNLRVKLFLTNTTKGTKGFYANGLNRLPANNAIMVYSDKGPISNYCLDDAYEVVVDCNYDYHLSAGSLITGTVTSISRPGETRPTMKENRLIFTARGESMISKISTYEVGDTITMETTLSDTYGNTEKWQNVTEAVGGHYVALLNGENYCPAGMYRYDPMTLIGFKPDGKVVIIVNDGRQDWYSAGVVRHLYASMCLDLGLDSVFLLDGGGSTTLVELTEQGYKLKNRPSDGATILTPGVERAVINAVILSYTEEIEKHNVTWKNGENVIYTEEIEEGNVPEYDEETYGIPAKAEDERYKYTFAGWDKTPEAVYADVIYTATFTSTEKYTRGDLNSDGKINASDMAILKKVIVGKAGKTAAADVDGDGKVTGSDAVFLKKKIVGKA